MDWGNANVLQGAANSLAATAAGNAQKPIAGGAAGVTKSAVAAGTVTIADGAAQQARTGKTAEETVASLNIDKIFDAQRVRDQQELNQLKNQVAQQAAPLIYQKVGDVLVGSSPETKAAVHALVGGLMSRALGGRFAAGAAGGAAASLAMEAFGKALLEQKDLPPDDRKALAQLAGLIVGGTAGGAAGGSVADVAAGANIGKVATQNNYLNHEQKDALAKELLKCQGDRACVISTTAKYQQIDEQQQADAKTCADGPSCRSIANDARTGSGFSYADAVTLCGGVKSCIDFAVGLGPRDVTDTAIANARRDRIELLAEAARTKDTLVENLDTVLLSGGSFGAGGGAILGVAPRPRQALPKGFSNAAEFSEFGNGVRSGLSRAGYGDVEPILQGSAVTGRSFRTGQPFDSGRISDFDVALASPTLIQRAKELGIGLRSNGTRTGPLGERDLQALGLKELAENMTRKVGRDVNFMIYDSPVTAYQRAPSIILPK